MAEQNLPNPPEEPHFLTYLLAEDTKHDCYFMVGKQELVEPKKIGVVKKMLMAHSSVLRVQLEWEESRLAEKEVVRVEVDDLYPDTFITLLKYVYGHDTTASLSFEEADDLLYAAEKYMMEPLKASLSSRLTVLLTPDNICQLLNNPACYGTLELQSAITEILQWETAWVLRSPSFLGVNVDGFIKILEQEAMDVEEIKVWRAAVKWAKHRGGTEDGKVLSEQLSEPLKHIRVCTISSESFLQEVVPTNILNNSSVKLVFMYHGTKEKQVELVQVSNEIKPRMKTTTNTLISPTKSLDAIYMDFSLQSEVMSQFSYFQCNTMTFGVELLPLDFKANDQSVCFAPAGPTYQCDCTVVIKDMTPGDDISTTPGILYGARFQPAVTVRFCRQVLCRARFQVPLTSGGENIRLRPNTKYRISVFFTEHHTMYRLNQDREPSFSDEHMAFEYERDDRYYYSPVKGLRYKPIEHDCV